MSIYQMTKQLPPLSVRDICMPEMWLSIQNTVQVTGRNLFLLSRVISSSLLHFLLSPPPSLLSLKKCNSIQRGTDCCSDKPNYRPGYQCGQSGPKQTEKTPTPVKIEHLFKFSTHLWASWKRLTPRGPLSRLHPPQVFQLSCYAVLAARAVELLKSNQKSGS